MLAGLHLDEGDATDRARELITLLVGSRRGRLEWEDLLLLARCHRQEGDEDGFADLLDQARVLVPSELERIHAQLDALEAAKGSREPSVGGACGPVSRLVTPRVCLTVGELNRSALGAARDRPATPRRPPGRGRRRRTRSRWTRSRAR